MHSLGGRYEVTHSPPDKAELLLLRQERQIGLKAPLWPAASCQASNACVHCRPPATLTQRIQSTAPAYGRGKEKSLTSLVHGGCSRTSPVWFGQSIAIAPIRSQKACWLAKAELGSKQ